MPELPGGTFRQRAVRTSVDGPAATVGLEPTVESLKEAIGCRLVDVVSVECGIDLWVNEEALLQAAPRLNLTPTLLAHASGVHIALFGAAVALSVETSTGETLGLSRTEAKLVRATTVAPSAATGAATAATISRLERTR